MTWASLLLQPALPELWLSGAILVLLVFSAFYPQKQQLWIYRLSLLNIVICAGLQYWVFTQYPAPIYLFSDMFVVDALSTYLKLAMYIATAGVLLYTKPYMASRQLLRGEYLVLALFALLGMNVMVSAAHLLVAYIGLEILSLALYALIAFQYTAHRAIEAAIKYFVLGALASGFLLYGISMLYGATHTLYLHHLFEQIAASSYEPTLLALSVVFILCGLAFKLGAAPFHMWVPDVYHGAPLSITLMISAAPKLAVIGFMIRLWMELLDGIPINWQMLLVILAVLSMTIGNIAAIVQTNVKRMLAYSTIAHMGFLLLGFIGKTPISYAATCFYIVTYVLMVLGVFGVLLALSTATSECETLEDLKGLNQRHSWYALVLLFMMFSMAGIPPMVGFYAKFSVIRSVVGLQLPNLPFDLTGLAVYAVVMSLIGAFYYLRVVKCLYMDSTTKASPIPVNWGMRVVLSVNALAVLLLGILPNALLDICLAVIQQSQLALLF